MTAPLTASAATYFVNGGSGDDTNSGSHGMPLATVQAALDAAAASPGHDAVVITSGIYEENLEIYDLNGLSVSGAGDVTIASPDSDQDVIKIDSGDILLSQLDIVGGDDGIDAENDDGTLTRLRLYNVRITGNGDRGLEVDDVDTVEIFGGAYSDNGDDGIKVDNPVSFRGTWIEVSGNGSDGFDVEGADSIRVQWVAAEGNGDEGLEVDDSDKIWVGGSLFNANADDGVDLDDVRIITVQGSQMMDNGDVEAGDGAGLQIVAEQDSNVQSATIRWCSFSGNATDGVQIVEEETVVESLSVKHTWATLNGESGYDVAISGTLTEHHNSSSGNGLPDTW